MSRKLKAQPASRSDPDPGRRGLLTGAFLTRKGRESIQHRQQPLGPRPPWHSKIMEHCTQCEQECEAACPQNIIKIHPVGHTHAASPWLDMTSAGCTLCGACAEACPSISEYRKESSYIGELQLATDTCLTWNGVLCMSCLGKCEVRALQLDERRRLKLNENLCIGCGMCIHTCPVDALAVPFVIEPEVCT